MKPCQDVSHAGARAGLKDGTRTGLWSVMRDAIATIRPRLVVAENVRGLLSADADSSVEPCPWCMGDPDTSRPMRALGAVLADLADIGYDAFWCGLRAADVGAPHGRFRVFIFAFPTGNADSFGVEGDRSEGFSFSAGHARPAAPQRAGRGPLMPTPRASDGEKGGPNQRGSSGDLMLPSAVHLIPTPSVADAMGGHERRGGARGDELLLNGMAKAGHLERFGDYGPAIAHWESITRPAPAPTGPTGKGGAHRLSPAFTEWMMGLPDGHVTNPAIWDGMKPSAARNAQLKACGNGVVPQQAAEATRRFLAWAANEARAA